MINLFKKQKKNSTPSFFDYKASEKKRIVKKAARESNKLQLDLVDKYFPKVKSQGVNKGRGEAAVIVGVAIARFSTLITKIRRQDLEKVKKWAKAKNNDADLVATSDLMRYLDSKIESLKK